MNVTVTPTWVTNESLLYFANECKGVANMNRSLSGEYRQAGAKVGDTVKARLPQQWQVTDGQGYSGQAIQDLTVNVTLTNQKGVHFAWSSQQGTTDIDEVRDRYVQPAAEALANAADILGMANVYRDVWNSVGTLGTTLTAASTIGSAQVKLFDGSTPAANRVAILDTQAMFNLSQVNAAFFQPGQAIAENWRKGMMGANQLGIEEYWQDQNIPRHVSGAITGAASPRINGAGQTGSTLNTNGWANGATNLKRGDIITIAGVLSVVPLGKQSTGRLQQFTITADTSDSAGAIAALPISPSLITSGPLQTVTASPGASAIITYFQMADGGTQAATTSPQSLIFHRDAFAFVMADLEMPNGGANGSVRRSKMLNVSLRYTEQWQALTDQNINRLDMLIGAATLQPRLACRVLG